MLAVNHSPEKTIRASGDSGWSLSIFHCKMNLYAKVCLFYTYRMVIANIQKGKNIFKCWLTVKYTEYSNIRSTSNTHLCYYICMCKKRVHDPKRTHTTLPCPSSCPAHLAGRSTAPLSCSVEAVSAAQAPSHLRPPPWPSCPPLLPPGGDHHRPPPAPR